MKKLQIALLILFIAAFSLNLAAQKPTKIGHIDFAGLYQLMPGMDSAQVKYQDYAKTLKAQLDAMQNEYETKLTDYQGNPNMPDLIKKNKEKEILDLQQRIQDFQQSAQESLSKKEQELTAPIIEKAKKAVQEVAKENGFSYIMNSAEGLGNLLYFEGGEDILVMVKKKLGLK
jgi:outer membrane protein